MIRRSSRAGYTLIEAIGLVLIVGLVLSFTGAILARAMKTNASAVQHLTSQIELRNLQSRLQADLRAASAVTFRSPNLLQITQDDSSVVYRFQSDYCDRIVGDAAALADVFEAAGQRWQLPGIVRVDCKTQETGRYPLLTVALNFQDTEYQPDTIQWAIRYSIDE